MRFNQQHTAPIDSDRPRPIAQREQGVACERDEAIFAIRGEFGKFGDAGGAAEFGNRHSGALELTQHAAPDVSAVIALRKKPNRGECAHHPILGAREALQMDPECTRAAAGDGLVQHLGLRAPSVVHSVGRPFG